MKPTLYDSQGHPVPLGPQLGAGGEGTVYEVADGQGLAAKVYRGTANAEQTAKLTAMVAGHKDSVLKFSAWPTGALHEKPGGPLAGFVMQRITGFKPIHTLYGPKSRMSEFPKADWAFLLSTATNLARAFAAIHAEGNIVIGDVNHGNVLVSSQALVKLIDCDSIQITAGGHTYLCGVGVSTHTPPELQGSSLRVLRTPSHDLFGLAVLLFQLLFMGRHPFSGRYLGAGDLALEKAIQEFRFAYGSSAKARQMLPPPYAPDLSLLTPAVASLFERAFGPEGARSNHRPTAANWVSALAGLKIQACRVSSAHSYPFPLSVCPWCALEKSAGTLLFNVGRASIPRSVFNWETIWAQVCTVPSPGPAPIIPAAFQATPSLQTRAVRRARIQRITLAGALSFSGLLLAIVTTELIEGCQGWLIALVVLGLLLYLAYKTANGASVLREEAREALREANVQLLSLKESWRQETSEWFFLDKQKSLKKLREDYLGISPQNIARRNEMEQALVQGVEDLQQLSKQLSVRRQALYPQIEAALRRVAQHEADLRAM